MADPALSKQTAIKIVYYAYYSAIIEHLKMQSSAFGVLDSTLYF